MRDRDIGHTSAAETVLSVSLTDQTPRAFPQTAGNCASFGVILRDHKIQLNQYVNLAGGLGFEPRLAESESIPFSSNRPKKPQLRIKPMHEIPQLKPQDDSKVGSGPLAAANQAADRPPRVHFDPIGIDFEPALPPDFEPIGIDFEPAPLPDFETIGIDFEPAPLPDFETIDIDFDPASLPDLEPIGIKNGNECAGAHAGRGSEFQKEFVRPPFNFPPFARASGRTATCQKTT
jgi:hypothetical protein